MTDLQGIRERCEAWSPVEGLHEEQLIRTDIPALLEEVERLSRMVLGYQDMLYEKRAQVSRLREGLEALVGEPNEGGEMVWFDHEWQRFRDVARSLLSTMEGSSSFQSAAPPSIPLGASSDSSADGVA